MQNVLQASLCCPVLYRQKDPLKLTIYSLNLKEVMPLPMYPKTEKDKLSDIRYIIGVAAGKGGVGKSSVAVNLAHALSRLGQKVGVLDADVYGPSLRRMLPEDQMPGQKGEIIIPALSQGIRTISMAYFRKDNEASVVRAPIANGIITQFLRQIAWGPLDFLLIDFPPGTGDVQLTLCQQGNLTGAIMVTTPQEVALLDVRKAINMFKQVQVPILGIVENMSYYPLEERNEKVFIFGQGGGERLASECDIPFLGGIPLDPEICRSGDQGNTVALYQDGEKRFSAKTFLDIASQTIERARLLKSQAPVNAFDLQWKDKSNG